jgi:hypothetical protein
VGYPFAAGAEWLTYIAFLVNLVQQLPFNYSRRNPAFLCGGAVCLDILNIEPCFLSARSRNSFHCAQPYCSRKVTLCSAPQILRKRRQSCAAEVAAYSCFAIPFATNGGKNLFHFFTRPVPMVALWELQIVRLCNPRAM